MKKVMLLKNRITNLRRGIGLVALSLTAFFSSCEQMNGSCENVKPGIVPCGTEVTVVGAGCASGTFQNRWLQLDNGDLLQPFENNTSVTKIEVGQKFLIGYETMKRDSRYDGQLACLALPPNGTPVRLHCMNPVVEPTENCNITVTARIVECSFGAWGNIWLQLEDGSYLQPWNNATTTTQLTVGATYKIGYAPMAKDNRFNNGVICAAMPSDPLAWHPEIVSVECLELITGK